MTLRSLHLYFLALFVLFATILFAGCQKDSFTTDANDKLSFSTDTLSFDTIFVDFGSTTDGFAAFNPHNQRIRVDRISLGGGESSSFRINVDGVPGTSVDDVEIWADDSLYVFVEVTVDPNDATTPYVVEDSIMFEVNGNVQVVHLIAYGQNAHFFGPGTQNGNLIGTTGDTTWTSDLPYVIFDGVIVDSLHKLTIEPGVRVHMHNQSVFYVKGTLEVNGGIDTSDHVRFEGTRLEPWYAERAGQWGGIYFLRGSIENKMSSAQIKNSTFGVRVDSLPASGSSPNLVLENSLIKNTTDSGIIAISSVISASNTLVFNCGKNNVQLEYGGEYAFTNCTFANFDGFVHKSPILRIGNYIVDQNDQAIVFPSTRVNFYNSILFGSEEEELNVDDITEGSGEVVFDIGFDNCLIRTELDQSFEEFRNCIFNVNSVNSLFTDAYDDDFSLTENSALRNAGKPFSEISNGLFIPRDYDFLGNPRNTEAPSIGCFEYVE